MEEYFKSLSQEITDSVNLPEPTLANLDSLITLTEGALPSPKDSIAHAIMQQQYIPKLHSLYKMASDLESEEDIIKFFRIYRGLCRPFIFLIYWCSTIA